MVVLIAFHRIGAVRLAGCLAHDLVDLNGGLVTGTVVSLAQSTYVPANGRLASVIFLYKTEYIKLYYNYSKATYITGAV